MRRLLAFIGGVLSGGMAGTLIGLLFTPASGHDMRYGLRQRYQNAIQAGQQAAADKRRELEAQLSELTSGPQQ